MPGTIIDLELTYEITPTSNAATSQDKTESFLRW